jgi:hypothetical protein
VPERRLPERDRRGLPERQGEAVVLVMHDVQSDRRLPPRRFTVRQGTTGRRPVVLINSYLMERRTTKIVLATPAPVPPRWIFQAPIADAGKESWFDRLCYALSYDLKGRAVFGRRDLRCLGPIPWGTPPPVRMKAGQKVKVRWTEPVN